MKNIFVVSLMILFSYFSLAQEDEGKGFRFGLKGDMSIDWLSIDNQKKFSSAGVGMGWGIGAQMEFKINKTTSFITGINLISARGGVDYFDSELNSVDSTFYVRNSDEEFVAWESAFHTSGPDTGMIKPGNNIYWLKERKYKINYVTIPIGLKLKTKEIGYLTYFGEFGGNIGIPYKTRVNDICVQGEVVTPGDYSFMTNGSTNANIDISDLDLSRGIQPIRAGLLIGAGAEFNFSGSTSLLFALHYNHYFTNALKKEDKEEYLRKDIQGSEPQNNKVGAKSLPGSVSLTVGVLF